jgi:hypothetical protein
MARRRVNCRRPPPPLTRVIDDRRIVKTGGSARQLHGSSRCMSCSVSSSWMAFDDAPVAQIDPSLGKSAAICAPGPQQFLSPQQFSSSKAPRNDAQKGSDSPDGQLDVVGGAGAHPDELRRRVMTTHPAAVDAGTRMASGGSFEARKYRTCGHGCVRREPAQERTRLSAGATKTTFVAEIRATRYFTVPRPGSVSSDRDLSVCNWPRMYSGRKKTMR